MTTGKPTPAVQQQQVLPVLLGVLPFVLFGAGWILVFSPGDVSARQTGYQISAALLIGGFVLSHALLLAGWMQGFPGWTMPYLFYTLAMALYLMNASTPGIQIFNIEIWGRELWGLRACVPLAVVFLMAAAFARSLKKPLSLLAHRLWDDWTLLAFGLYGMLPLVNSIAFDEMDHNFTFPLIAAVQIIITLGALLYLLLEYRRRRITALIAATILAGLLSGASTSYYWQKYTTNFTTNEVFLTGQTPNLTKALTSGLTHAGVTALVIFLLPLLLWLLHTTVRSSSRP